MIYTVVIDTKFVRNAEFFNYKNDIDENIERRMHTDPNLGIYWKKKYVSVYIGTIRTTAKNTLEKELEKLANEHNIPKNILKAIPISYEK